MRQGQKLKWSLMSNSSSTITNINFFSEDIDFNLEHKQRITEWINSLCNNHDFEIEELTYIFCSDEYLLGINRQYLNHDTYTDIITFNNSNVEGIIMSDIFISVERVKENAKTQEVLFETELLRVLIHGVLHLIGFNDKTDEEKTLMRKKEDECISLFQDTK